MRIAYIDIQNFRKLKYCHVELANEETVFVGANNSGKTSAMDALIMFLTKSKRKRISTTDFTISNWAAINRIGEAWVAAQNNEKPDLSIEIWRTYVPSLDVWLKIDETQIHYVSHILPSLDWDGGLLGVRLVLEPTDVEKLYREFTSAFKAAKKTMDSRSLNATDAASPILSLWPTSMRDFLERDLHNYFAVMAYVLDPLKAEQQNSQPLPENSEPLDRDPFDGLFKIDVINAQRGFSDSSAGEGGAVMNRRLSSQLRNYFDEHLDPTTLPDVSDLDALEAIEVARTAFDTKLQSSFSAAIRELEELNYPGFGNPQILLSSKVNPIEGLNHESAVQFSVTSDMEQTTTPLWLPENYNGLGYQNLISMIFSLIRFRDEWMRVGKAGMKASDGGRAIEPLHLTLIEEPEAHLHAHIQQVFIRKAFNVLRNHPLLKDGQEYSTQLVVSTHSSHIAHETDFTRLRYFRRRLLTNQDEIPCADVVNMTTTFGDEVDTLKFATRYLKTTHCDLFFADAVILVEGPAERMLVPHFIRCGYPVLDKCYVSVLEIGGSHAHRLRPLLETLGLLTLVVTDLDSIESNSTKKVRPRINLGFRTGNVTLGQWLPSETELDSLLRVSNADKVSSDGRTRVAYPSITPVKYESDTYEEAIPYTFEDALVLSNLELFREMLHETGLIGKMKSAVVMSTLDGACEEMYIALESGKKAEMALDLLFTTEPSRLAPPSYVAEGLEWLQQELSGHNAANLDEELTTEDGHG